MIIIIEGPDCVGKSTLARDIQTQIIDPPHEIIRRGPPKRHPIYEYEPYKLENVICDRWHLGELVYGPILRDHSRLDHAQLHHIRMYLQAKGAYVLQLTASHEVLAKRLIDRGDDLIDANTLHSIIDAYLLAPGFPVFIDQFTFSESPTMYTHQYIAEAAMKYARRVPVDEHSVLKTYVGSPAPSTVFVGDRRAKGHESEFTSAFVPLLHTSGHFLFKTLVNEFDDHEMANFGVFNINEVDVDLDEVPAAIQSLGDPRLVALGVNAHLALQELGIKHGVVPHPQYVRRFFHSKSKMYGRIIRGTMNDLNDRRSWRPN